MQPIDSFDLRLFDMNLLVAFDALMCERSVTKAAKRMRVGQPSMSHSLATLRVLLRDELLVRVGNSMEPTSHALLLHERVAQGLATIQGAVRLSQAFEPAIENRMFRLGFASDVELALMPQLIAVLQSEAPGVRVVGHLADPRDVENALDEGRLDLALGCFKPRGNRFRIRPMYQQELRCVWNPDQLPIKLPLTQSDYLGAAHIAMTLDDNLRGCLDAALAEAGATLNVVGASDQFLSVLSIVAASPVMATLPSRVALLHAARFGLIMAEPPVFLKLPPISLLWSKRLDQDPAVMWLCDRVADCLQAHVESACSQGDS